MSSPKKAQINDDRFNISLKVKNTGAYDGAEIVQLYVTPKDKNSSLKPIQLKGFKRVELKIGEEKTVTFKVSLEQLVQYKNEQWIIEGGKFEFMVGASSTDIRLKKDVNIKGKNKILTEGRKKFFSLID